MRLIDADEIKADYIVSSTTSNARCYLYASLEQIQNAPTIDPVRHGHWIEQIVQRSEDEPSFSLCVCSNCGLSLLNKMTRYCPTCGAQMWE